LPLTRLCAVAALLSGCSVLSACGLFSSAPRRSQPALPPAPPQNADPVVVDGDHNLLHNSDFEGGTLLPWMVSWSGEARGSAAVESGELCLTMNRAGQDWHDAQVRHRDMKLSEGHRYALVFEARASRPIQARPRIGMAGPPYVDYFASTVELGPEPRRFVGYFSMTSDDEQAELAFQFGAASEDPVTVCLDTVRLDDPDYLPAARLAAARAPKVRINQLGYFSALPKRATLAHASTEALSWQLRSGEEVLLEGNTTVHGADRASGDHVHWIDFSSFDRTGSDYVLVVGEHESHPFDVRADLYATLRSDALWYFYHNRSGVPLVAEHAGAPYARPAGHLSDARVECLDGLDCGYTLDVSGGWYDAGDHGKYVVNGGISLWTMLNQYERASIHGDVTAYADGTLRIPEAGNGVPDLLDEARWELEFLLKMQVPTGPLAGMAHHKIHNDKWTSIPQLAHEDDAPRHLHAPSTAATLNLAATAAQGARIYRRYDETFAERCLIAAELAWQAAEQHPEKYAPGDDNVGGGPYADGDVSDERYWAAAELFITTGKTVYREALTSSPHYLKLGPHQAAMAWETTQALGTISLAVVPNELEDVKQARQAIRATADRYLSIIAKEGYRLPLAPDDAGNYLWGSNSLVLNNMIVLALAADLSGEQRYLEGVVDGMDYLLGRNPLAQSYVTGYGDQPLTAPHHRHWAKAKDPSYPGPPPGAVSGGPNSSIQDPAAQEAGLRGCAPQRCFIDDIDAWSVNEVTINWNAPFAWVVAFLDEKGSR